MTFRVREEAKRSLVALGEGGQRKLVLDKLRDAKTRHPELEPKRRYDDLIDRLTLPPVSWLDLLVETTHNAVRSPRAKQLGAVADEIHAAFRKEDWDTIRGLNDDGGRIAVEIRRLGVRLSELDESLPENEAEVATLRRAYAERNAEGQANRQRIATFYQRQIARHKEWGLVVETDQRVSFGNYVLSLVDGTGTFRLAYRTEKELPEFHPLRALVAKRNAEKERRDWPRGFEEPPDAPSEDRVAISGHPLSADSYHVSILRMHYPLSPLLPMMEYLRHVSLQRGEDLFEAYAEALERDLIDDSIPRSAASRPPR